VTILGEGPGPFADRADAGRVLARELAGPREGAVVVYGLARGGVPVAAEVARALGAPLDALVVRKVGHPLHEEYALGAVTADGPPFLRELRGLDGRAVPELRGRVQTAAAQARAMDGRLHQDIDRLDPSGATCVLVDDGLATGATMVAACRWARAHGASRVVAAVPVGARDSVDALRAEADEVVCPHPVYDFWAVSIWYADFGQTGEDEVRALLREGRPPGVAAARGAPAGPERGPDPIDETSEESFPASDPPSWIGTRGD
jgi:putative phosphoribosyl transferase